MILKILECLKLTNKLIFNVEKTPCTRNERSSTTAHTNPIQLNAIFRPMRTTTTISSISNTMGSSCMHQQIIVIIMIYF